MTTPDLGFSPAGLPLGIGSLPHRDPFRAVELVRDLCPEIPFWPQLPRLSPREGFVASCLGPALKEVRDDEDGFAFRLPRGRVPALVRAIRELPDGFPPGAAAGWTTLLKAVTGGEFQDPIAVKGQIPGPLSLTSCFREEGETQGGFVLDRQLRKVIVERLIRLARWQIEILSRFRLPVLLFVDEPALFRLQDSPQTLTEVDENTPLHVANLEFLDGLRTLIEEIRLAGASPGLHCCSQMPATLLSRLGPDFYSFDAYHGLEALLEAPETGAFLEAGGRLAFGLVPTQGLSETPPVESLAKRLDHALTKSGFGTALLDSSLCSASCGLGNLEPNDAETVLRQVRALSERLRTS